MIPISTPYITNEEIEAVAEVLRSNYIAYGPKAHQFEKMFAEYIGTKYARAVSNGTLGLMAAIKALGIGEGDEVITPAFSFIASANAVLYNNAKPIFADIDLSTYTIDPEDTLEKITPKTRAIILVHLYGHPCDIKPFLDIASDHKLYIIEDASQAHGATYNGKKVGSFGDIAVFSLYATKNMTTGEGGIIVTNDEEIDRRIKLIMDHGQISKYNHIELGYNLRMPDILAAIGIVQLKRLDMLNEVRRKNAEFLTRNLNKIPEINLPIEAPYAKHVYHQYVIRTYDRDDLKNHLGKYNIQTDIHYPKPIYRQELYRKLGYGELHLENSEIASKQVLSLPVHPLLTNRDLNNIVKKIIEYYENK